MFHNYPPCLTHVVECLTFQKGKAEGGGGGGGGGGEVRRGPGFEFQ